MAEHSSPALDDSPRRLPEFLRPWPVNDAQIASAQIALCGNHDHLAIIYDKQDEQLDFIVPYLRQGLERGEKSVYIYDDNSAATVIAAMERYGIDVAAAMATGALAILTRRDAYLRNGDFDPDWMISFLGDAVETAEKEGFSAVRASGEMTWALGPAGDAHNRLVEYECMLNTFFPGYNMGGICQYNRRRFRPETLMHVIHTHPRLVFRGNVCDNPYYISADVLEARSGGMDDAVRRLLESMAENTRLRRQLSAETEALRRTEKMAAAGRMAAAIAHEINNPLEAITNLCYLLNHEELSPNARACVTAMGEELDRISHIARQTLEFYRAGTRAKQVDLVEEIDDAVGEFRQRAQAQGAAIDVEHRGAARVYGLAGELRQLLENLVVNALEAGAGRIRIRTRPGRDWRKPVRRGVRILVADNGPGIAADAAGKVFEPFFSTKERKGTGLGLWVSHGIVEKHEGSIGMRTSTRPGRTGTALSIFLPTA